MASAEIRLGGPDLVSIRTALSFPHRLFISPLVDNSDRRLHSYLLKINFERGAAAFGGESDGDVAQFRELTGSALETLSAKEVYRIIHYFRQRVVNYAHIGTMAAAEILIATVCGDRACCPHQNGETISVVDAVSKLKLFREMDHERYGKQVFGRNWGFPPFHIGCTCRMQGIIEGTECHRVFRKTREKRLLGKWR